MPPRNIRHTKNIRFDNLFILKIETIGKKKSIIFVSVIL